jgi:hypothetical protein
MRQFLLPRAAADLPVSSNGQSANRQVKNSPARTGSSAITALHDLTINSHPWSRPWASMPMISVEWWPTCLAQRLCSASPAAYNQMSSRMAARIRRKLARRGPPRLNAIESSAIWRAGVAEAKVGPAAAHADDKGGPADIAGTRPGKLALRGIEMPEQTDKMVKITNRRRDGGRARRIARLAIGKARFLDKIRPSAAAASRRGMRRAGQRMQFPRRTRQTRRHVGDLTQLSRDGTRRGSGCHG